MLTVYTFNDSDGHPYGSFTTLDYAEAKSYAAENSLRVIANEYEYADSEPLDDYTGAGGGGAGDLVEAYYRCPRCNADWAEETDTPCDAECGTCGLKAVTPARTTPVLT